MPRFAFVALLFLAVSIVLGDESDPAAMAAKERQDRARSVLIEYRQVSRLFTPGKEGQKAKEGKATADNRIILDGRRVRIEDNNPSRGMFGSFSPLNRLDTHDGDEGRTLYLSGRGQSKSSQGLIYSTTDTITAKPVDCIFVVFRGLESGFGYPTLAMVKPTGRGESIEKVECPEFEHVAPARVTRYWVDPAKGLIVRKIQIEERGKATRTSHVNYRQDASMAWALIGWRNEYPSPEGPVGLIEECTVTKLELNDAFDDETFRLAFPPGGRVANRGGQEIFSGHR